MSKDDLAELSQTAQPEIETSVSEENNYEDVSLDKVSESENKEQEVNSDETDSSNS